MPNVKTVNLTFEQVNDVIAYDPDLGTFTWKVDASKNVKAGSPAGCFKGVRKSRKTGLETRYMYIRYEGYEIPAARVAWLLTHGEWPEGNIKFEDGNTANFKLENLSEAKFVKTIVHEDGVKQRKMTKDAQRHYGLKRYYGMSLEEYQERLLAQNGVCAICEKPEVAIHHGKVRTLSVDHDHETGAVRDLLCSYCNSLLGQAKDDRNVLLAAIKYLDKHSGSASSVVPLTMKGDA
ncbi:MAG: HNH endonuclease [Patescibacteria group bacterium]|nr:HNH endonuclease [Patescibacteria group bacterium]